MDKWARLGLSTEISRLRHPTRCAMTPRNEAHPRLMKFDRRVAIHLPRPNSTAKHLRHQRLDQSLTRGSHAVLLGDHGLDVGDAGGEGPLEIGGR